MEPTRNSTSSQGTQPAHAARTKPGQGADTRNAGAASAAAGDFLALLSALGAEPLAEGPLPVGSAYVEAADGVPLGGAADTADRGHAADACAVAAWQGLLLSGSAVPPAPGTLPEGGGAAAGQAGFPPPGGAFEALPRGRSDVADTATGMLNADGTAAGLVAETLKLDASAGGAATPLAAGAAAAARMVGRPLGGAGLRTDALPGARGAPAQGEGPSSAHASAAAIGALLAPHAAGGPGLAVGGPAERSAVGAARPAAAEMATSFVQATMPGTAESMVRGETAAGGGRTGQGAAGDAATWFEGGAADTRVDAGVGDAAGLFADPTQAGAEEQVTDRVAYWINQRTQNAELTLDRDGQPVEVSVTLSGNEAHVSFRSDQAQTRDLLDQSMAQLRDLLRSEGLVLSGMSVGTSAGRSAGGGSPDSQRQREAGRHAQVAAAAALAVAGGTAHGGAKSDRAVDIFV